MYTAKRRPQLQRWASSTYLNLYLLVLKQMYRRLQPLYEEIRRITGYAPK